MLYENCKIYGPYVCQDKRKRIVIIWPDGFQTSISYARFLMEKALDRYLSSHEEVDHIDDDKTNDVITNLQILSSLENREKQSKYLEPILQICWWCEKAFELTQKQQRTRHQNRLRTLTGPFCSRTCAGQYSTSL